MCPLWERAEEILIIENDGEDTQLEELKKKLNETKLNKAIYDEIINNDCVDDST